MTLKTYTPGESPVPSCPCCRPRRWPARVGLLFIALSWAAGCGGLAGVAVGVYRWVANAMGG